MKKAAVKSRGTAGKTRKPRKTVQFLQKSTCTTCRKARDFMKRRGYQLQYRDLIEEPLKAADIEKLIGDRDHTEFLNPRSATYRENEMGEDPPSRREAIRLMAKDPSLIRRPVIVAGGRVVLGFDKEGMVRL